MPANYVLLERVTLTASAASVVFDNIPQSGYTDLKVVISGRTNRILTVDGITFRFNNDNTSGNYSGRRMYGDGSSAASDSTNAYAALPFMDAANSTANVFGNAEMHLPNYLSSNTKSFTIDGVGENNATLVYSGIGGGTWTGTAAINSITIYPETGTAIIAGSSFSLYGVAALGTTPVIAPKATGGDIVVSDGTYWYHAFLNSSLFTPNQALSCAVLTIAGGGGGSAGGGGAGGLVYSASNSLTATSYSVTVGAGGAGRGGDADGSQGTNSQFGALTAAIGGGYGAGGAAGTVNGGNGGSGGGAGAAQGSTLVTASGGTGSQGFNGGSLSSASRAGGGGGGAGQVGANGTTNTGGVGGNGLNTYSSWASATGTGADSGYYAGGGGGTSTSTTTKAGGLGGGGAGGGDSTTEGVPGTAGTGGGGGGSRTATGGRAGGSGIVIVRYTVA